jgi:hypothetical protein
VSKIRKVFDDLLKIGFMSKSIVGLRVNPLVGSGLIAELRFFS